MKHSISLILILLLPSCSNFELQEKYLYGLTGGAAGALLGSTVSPNDESKGLNALMFGALGAGAGMLVHYLKKGRKVIAEVPSTLEGRELKGAAPREMTVPATTQKLPDFVRARLTPIVIEEYLEKDTVGEDGSLIEPHRVWRIKHQPELVPSPQK
jgi:hypothetical protein